MNSCVLVMSSTVPVMIASFFFDTLTTLVMTAMVAVITKGIPVIAVIVPVMIVNFFSTLWSFRS